MFMLNKLSGFESESEFEPESKSKFESYSICVKCSLISLFSWVFICSFTSVEVNCSQTLIMSQR